MSAARTAIAAILVLVAGGCATGPGPAPAAPAVPAAWRGGEAAADAGTDLAWWERFGDPVLDRLVRAALAGSTDMKIAAARVDQALALLEVSGAAQWPQVNGQADAGRDRASRSTLQGQAIPAGRQVYGAVDLVLTATWEIDVWGRLRRASEAARARMLASEEARRAVAVSLVSATANAYIQLRGLDRQLEIARGVLASRRESLRLQAVRFEGGAIQEGDLRQAESQMQVAAATVPQLEREVAQQENLIRALAGANPGAVERGRAIGELAFPPVPGGLPASLLERRPDLRQAEQSLAAANADVGAARAAMLPRVSLAGLLGLQSAQLSTLLRDASGAWSLGAGIAQPIFNGGALAGQVHFAEAGSRAALYAYQAAVTGALQEVEDALIARSTLERQQAEQARNVDALRRLRALAQRRYDEGATIYLEVASAEQALFDAELALVGLQAQLFEAYANLYKALGGGWIDLAAPAAPGGGRAG